MLELPPSLTFAVTASFWAMAGTYVHELSADLRLVRATADHYPAHATQRSLLDGLARSHRRHLVCLFLLTPAAVGSISPGWAGFTAREPSALVLAGCTATIVLLAGASAHGFRRGRGTFQR